MTPKRDSLSLHMIQLGGNRLPEFTTEPEPAPTYEEAFGTPGATYVCSWCGASVVDRERHTDWHLIHREKHL